MEKIYSEENYKTIMDDIKDYFSMGYTVKQIIKELVTDWEMSEGRAELFINEYVYNLKK